MSDLISSSSGGSFLSTREGRFGAVVTTVLTGLFGWGLYKILPALVNMAQNVLMLGLYVVAIMALFYVTVLDSSLRNLLLNFYKRFIQALYILSFNIDPTGGLTVRLQEKKEELAQAKQEAGKVKGQSQAIADTMQQNQSQIDDGLKKMEYAKRKGTRDGTDEAQAESVIVGVASAANKDLDGIKTKIDGYYNRLLEIIHKAELAIRVLDGVIQIKTRTFNAAKATRSSMKRAMGVLFGDAKKDEIFDANIKWIDDYASVAFGEVDALMDLSKDALQSIDLQQGVYSEEAFQLLDERLHSAEKKLDGDPRSQKLLEAANDPSAMADIATSRTAAPAAVAVVAPQSADFSRVFTRANKK